MRKSSFLVLLVVTVAFAAAAAVAVIRGDRVATQAMPERRAFPGLAAHLGDLAWMRLVHGNMNADFGAIAGKWAVVEKANYPASPGKVRRLLLGLADLTLVEPKTRRPELFERLGLDDPHNGRSTLVALQDRIGNTVAELLVGKSRADRFGGGNSGVYVRKPNEDQTWLARGSLDLPSDIKDWLDRRIVDIPPSRVAAVTLTTADGAVLTLRRDSTTGKFAVADPPPDAKFKDEPALAAPAGALENLDLDDVKPNADLPLPPSGVAIATVATFDGLTLTAHLFAYDKRDWLALAAAGSGEAKQEAAKLNERLARWVYAIPADRAKLLRTTLADLVAPAKGS